MNKNLISLICLFFLISCSTTQNNGSFPITEEQGRIIFPFSSMNEKVYGEVSDQENYSFDSFGKAQYMKMLSQWNSDLPTQFKELLKDYDIMTIKGYSKTYVICIYSTKLEFGLCDDPRCIGIPQEQMSKSKDPVILSSFSKNLPKNECVKKL